MEWNLIEPIRHSTTCYRSEDRRSRDTWGVKMRVIARTDYMYGHGLGHHQWNAWIYKNL